VLVGEAVWLELEPDRGSRHVAAALEEAVDLCRAAGRGCSTSTSPSGTAGGRTGSSRPTWTGSPARPLHRPLDPDPVVIDGRRFDPVAHFRRRRDEMAERGTPAERRQEVLGKILAFAAGLPPAVPPGDHAALADALNGAGIRTTTGRNGRRKTSARS
jgi:hypothetical protein